MNSAVDFACVVVVVAAAVGWLLSRFRSPKPPACHQGAPVEQRGGGGAAGGDSVVVVGASLQKGLQRARNRAARSTEKRVNA